MEGGERALDGLPVLYQAIRKSVLGRYAAYAVGIASLMILARVFSPELFGIIAATQVAFTFALVLAESGFGPAIINLDRLDADDRDGIYSVTLIMGLAFAGGLALLAGPIASFYAMPDVARVVPFVAVAVFLASATVVPLANLNRDQAFYWVGGADAVGEAGSTVITLALLPFFDPLSALAARLPARVGLRGMVLMWAARRTEFGCPRPGTRLSAVRPLLTFSTLQLGFNFVNFFSRNLDAVLVGRYLGPIQLGIYDKGYQLMRYPLMMLTFAMNPAIQPVLRHRSHDLGHVERLHTDFVSRMAWLGVSAGVVLLFGAPWIVRVVLGPDWTGVVPIIQILAVAVPAQIVLSTSGAFFQAMDRTGLLFLSGCLSTIPVTCAMLWGISQSSLPALTWSLVLAFHINFLQAYCIMYRAVFGAPVLRMLRRVLIPACIVAGMGLWAGRDFLASLPG
jgi:O-antigen/teichoic acid export membrane protein